MAIVAMRRALQSLAITIVLTCVLPLRGDVLLLADGSRVSGRLTFCDEETCTVDKKKIPLDQIAQIGLGANPKLPMARRGGNIVLTDGTIRPGRFTGLNLGYVFVDDEEVERELVAFIVPGSGAPAKDLLVASDGSTRAGILERCNAASCTLDGAVIPLEKIRWIGLGQEDETPPSAAADTVYFLESDPIAARLSALDDANVSTTRGTFRRTDVRWIHLAAAQPPPPQGTGGRPIHHDDPAPPPGAPPSAPPPATPPGSPAPGAPPTSALPPSTRRGPLWTGTIASRLWGTTDGVFSVMEAHVDVKIRELISPMLIPGSLKPIGTVSAFQAEGTVLRNSVRCSGSGISCSGQGTTTLRQENASAGAAIYRKTKADSSTAYYGVEIPQNKALYFLSVGPSDNPHFDVTYRNASGTDVSPLGFSAPGAGRVPLVPPHELSDLEYRYLEGGAMRGSFTKTLSDGKQYAVSWSVCPEGMSCPPAAPLPEEEEPESDDPCARSGQQAALSDTCRSQLDHALDSLAPALAEYNALMASAEANRGAFQAAQNYCALYDQAKEILEAILTGGAGPAAEAAQALLYLRDVIEKVQDGDLGSMLIPEQAQKFLGYYEKAKGIWFELTADEISKMGRDLNACSGKVPVDTYLAAEKFLADLAAAKQVWNSKVAPGMNDLRSKGLECAGLAHAAWRACQADAECRGEPPNCGPEPSLAGAYDE